MLVISFGLIVGYVIAYAASYHQRASAANMAFWYYGERDDVMYPTFYPVYRIHQRVLGAPRHNRDRAPAAETSAGP